MSNALLQQFLNTRRLIDADARNVIVNPGNSGKSEIKTMERPAPENGDTVRSIIEAKPSKKLVMEFLKRKVAQYTDASSDDDM